ncbi:mucin-associated surface protein (MASP), putative, partial [Trypanosoma cruzi]
MMTGRVLLVCVLCVLWCGVCGGERVETSLPDSPGTQPEKSTQSDNATKAVAGGDQKGQQAALKEPPKASKSKEMPASPPQAQQSGGGVSEKAIATMDSKDQTAQTNLDGQEVSITNAETQSSIKPHAEGNQIVNRDEAGGEKERKAAVTGETPSNQQPTSLQPVQQEQPKTDSHTRQKEERDSEEAHSPPPAPSPTNSTEGIPATRELQILT